MASVVIGTAGHIDHGKSTLVQALTGIDPDRLKEEQARGITIDLGFAHVEIDGTTVAFVDVPGHERFVRNMLAGAGGIDAVLLVVAADESVMPQTREHFHICRLLGLDRGVIALTRIDLATDDVREIARAEVRDLVHGSFLADAPIVPVSARTGQGLTALRAALTALAGASPRQAREGIARLPIDRVFTAKGFGAVITGTLISGALAIGDELALLPAGRGVRVRGLQVHGSSAARVEAPARVAVNLGGVDAADIARGQTLATPGALSATRRVDLRLELLPDAPPLRHGSRVRIHHGTGDLPGRVVIAAAREARTLDWQRASPGAPGVVVPPGGHAYVRLRLEQPAILTRGDRVVLRAYTPAVTIGGGVVLDPDPPVAGLRRPPTLLRFEALDGALDERAAEIMLDEAAARGLEIGGLASRLGLGIATVRALLGRGADAGRAIVTRTHAFTAAAAGDVEAALLRALEEFHRARPLEAGQPRETLRAATGRFAAPALVDYVLDQLAERRVVSGTERVALAAHRPAVSADDVRLRDGIEAHLRAAGLTPPDLPGLAAALQAAPAVVERLVAALVREKRLLRLDQIVFHAEALSRLKLEVQQGKGEPAGATVDVAAFKRRYGLTRKFAIPILEWLDRERVTRRSGDTRVVL